MAAVDQTTELQAAVVESRRKGTSLEIRGGGSKRFYGRQSPADSTLPLGGHRGIVSYEPSELVLTARAGTPLSEIEQTLAEADQMLAFEPPHLGQGATLGGTIACGLSGPRRPYAGAARDFVLGAEILNGRGERLKVGGQVMKNVAGYDLSRLMVGALGTLGVLLEIALKVLPRPAAEHTLARESDAAEALQLFQQWGTRPLPISAAAFDGSRLFVRLSGADSAVGTARRRLGGEPLQDGPRFWRRLREHESGFFSGPEPLWRLSLPTRAPAATLTGKWLWEWGGAQRWLRSHAGAAEIWHTARELGGHATLFRGGDREGEVFQPLTTGLSALHHRIKQALDPEGILNPGRLYRGL
jgi:glycolate oxidase FAD binding subunit